MSRNLQAIIGVLTVFVLFGVMLYSPLPPQFETRGILLTDEIILFVTTLLLCFTLRRKEIWWRYISLFLTLMVFTLPLMRLWETAESTWNIILGLLPWADAVGYYSDATNLINGGLFSAFSGRRPIFASFLAVLLKSTNQNLQLVLIVFTVLNGLAVFMFALEIRKRFGFIAAAVAIYFLHFFYRSYIGTTLTEQLGIPAGLLAFAVLLRSVDIPNRKLFFIGMLILTFSLFVRAGAFFVLPLLMLFGVFFFMNKGRSTVQIAIMIMVFVLTPIALNMWLGKNVASPKTIQFGNFSYTLYGQAVGGKRWTQVMIDHPELNALQEPELSREIYRLAFDEIAKNPLGLIRGAATAWKDFIIPGSGSLFSFIDIGNKQMGLILQCAITILFLIGLGLLWRGKNDPIYSFILVSEFGIFISIPFLPPVDAGIRPYAATIAVIILPVLVIISALSKKWGIDELANDLRTPFWDVGLGLGLVIVSVFGGVYLKYISRPIQGQPLVCSSGLVSINFKVSTGAYLHFVKSDTEHQTQIPAIQLKHVFRSFDAFPYGDFASVMRKIDEPVFITLTVDTVTGNQMWVIAPTELINHQGKIISACARFVPDPYPMMYLEYYETY